MKKLVYFAVVSLLLAGCGGQSQTPPASGQAATDAQVVNPSSNPFPGTTPGLIITDTAMWKQPGNVDWLDGLKFNQAVYYTGESKEVGQNTFFKVKNSGGKEGWINKYLVAFNAVPGVVVTGGPVYTAEDLFSVSASVKVEEKTLVMVSTQTYKEGLKKISWYNGQWVQFEQFFPDKDLSTVEADWGAIQFIKAADAQKDEGVKKTLLKNALSKYPTSRYASVIEGVLGIGAGGPGPGDGPQGYAGPQGYGGPEGGPGPGEMTSAYMVTADGGLTIRSTPSTSGDSLGLLAKGAVIYTNNKSDQQDTIGGITAYWFKLSDQPGWVFGGFITPYGP